MQTLGLESVPPVRIETEGSSTEEILENVVKAYKEYLDKIMMMVERKSERAALSLLNLSREHNRIRRWLMDVKKERSEV